MMTRKKSEHHNTDEERHMAILETKRNWYYRNQERSQVKALINYYKKILRDNPNNEKAQVKLEDLNKRLEQLPLIRINDVIKPPPETTPQLRFKKPADPAEIVENVETKSV